MVTATPQLDTRSAQAARVAGYLERNPASTSKEIDAVCDTGCISRVLSAMEKELFYGLSKRWRYVSCADGTHRRRVRTYVLLYRPRNQSDLFTPTA